MDGYLGEPLDGDTGKVNNELILCIIIVSPDAQLKACPPDPGCCAHKYTGWDSFVRRIPDVSF